jgi:hypothetical protein
MNERRGYIVLFDGGPETSPVTILRETATQFVIRHESDWSNRKKGDIRRISKRYVAT